MGRFETTVDELFEDYVKPQENGSHFHCREVNVSGRSMSLRVRAKDFFSFNASRYTTKELTEKAHNYELLPSDNMILHVDLGMSGVGSNSCGPGLATRYRLEGDCMENEIQFVITKM